MGEKKPPLGLIAEHIHAEKRIDEILSAMMRYSKANTPIPCEWVVELGQLVCRHGLAKTMTTTDREGEG